MESPGRVESSPRTPKKVPSLSKELPDLLKDDTKCGYCGVSYLIHSKVKTLEDKVKQLKEQLQRYETVSNLEEHLQKEHEQKIDALKEAHQKEFVDLIEKHNQAFAYQHNSHKNVVVPLQEELNRKKRALRKVNIELRMVQARFMSHRMQFTQFKDEVQLQMQQFSESVEAIGPPIYTKVFALKIDAMQKSEQAHRATNEANLIKGNVERLEKELQEALNTIPPLQSQARRLQDRNSEKEKQIEALKKQVDELTSAAKAREQIEGTLRKELRTAESTRSKMTTDLSSIARDKETEISIIKKKLVDLQQNLEETNKAASTKQQEYVAQKTTLESQSRQISDLQKQVKDMVSNHQKQVAKMEEDSEAKISSLTSKFTEQLKELQKKDEFEKALAKTKHEHTQEIDKLRKENEREMNQKAREISSLRKELDEARKLASNAQDYLPLEIMEQQLLKLIDIIAKKEKEITHLQMVVKFECDERTLLQEELGDLKAKLANFSSPKR